MMDEREIAAFLLHSTQEECREVGEQFLELSKVPRDAAWKAKWRAELERLPKSSLALEIEAARRRVAEYDRSNGDTA